MVPHTAVRARPQQQLRRAISPTHTAGLARLLFTQLNRLAEDKRFELLSVSPTRFPILLLPVRRQSGPCVTRHDGTGQTVPAAAERPRMRRKLRRTGRVSPGSAVRYLGTVAGKGTVIRHGSGEEEAGALMEYLVTAELISQTAHALPRYDEGGLRG